MSDAVFIKNPSEVMWSYLKQRHPTRDHHAWFQYGQLAMALEIITVVKTLEGIPVVSELGRQETVSVLQTLLTDMKLDGLAYDVYEQLNEWRKPTFLAASGASSGEVRDGNASGFEAPPDAPALEGNWSAWHRERQSLPPSSGSGDEGTDESEA